MAFFRPTVAEINLTALTNNVSRLRERAGLKTWFCPMIKANAYGHGAVQIGKTLESMNVDALGVAMAEEGLELRAAGIRAPILVFGLFGEESARACINENLTPVISRGQDLDVFSRLAESPLAVHLKFNTGMNRLGFEVSEASRIATKLKAAKNLLLKGLASHFMQGEDWALPDGTAKLQARKLREVAAHFPGVGVLHLLNSGALIAGKTSDGFGVRPGIAIYGAGFDRLRPAPLGLQPVMSLKSKIALIQHLNDGDGVSYNSRWRATGKTAVGVIPIGYADGVHRLLTQRASVLVRGLKIPLVGTVCMDYIMCDLTGLGMEIEAGEPVCLWGTLGDASILADEVASQAETIAYELFTGVSRRVPRKYLDGAKSWLING